MCQMFNVSPYTSCSTDLQEHKVSFQIGKIKKKNQKHLEAGCRWLMPYNSSYSGGRDQEDLILKKPITKKDWWSGSRCRPWVHTPVLQKKKPNQNKNLGCKKHMMYSSLVLTVPVPLLAEMDTGTAHTESNKRSLDPGSGNYGLWANLAYI
jgi:hypothetical protein